MANNTSRGRFAGWELHGDTVADEFSVALDSNIGFQENLPPQVQSESRPDSRPTQGIQAPGMSTFFVAGTEPCKSCHPK